MKKRDEDKAPLTAAGAADRAIGVCRRCQQPIRSCLSTKRVAGGVPSLQRCVHNGFVHIGNQSHYCDYPVVGWGMGPVAA